MSQKKLTQAQLAKKYNVTRETVNKWKNLDKIDIYDEDVVASHSRKNSASSHKVRGSIHEQIANAKNFDDARFIKTKIEAAKQQQQLEILQGDYIKNSEVKESTIRILSILKAGMQKLESDLPNKLYGLDAADIQKEIRAATTSLLTQFNQIALREFGE